MDTITVIKFFGGKRGAKSKIAKTLGISSAAVSKWGKSVPNGSAYLLLVKFPELATFTAPPVETKYNNPQTIKTRKHKGFSCKKWDTLPQYYNQQPKTTGVALPHWL